MQILTPCSLSPLSVCRHNCLGFSFRLLNGDDVFVVISTVCDIGTGQLFYSLFVCTCEYVSMHISM